VIPLLIVPGSHGADVASAFDVVVPDMPGYRYSDRPTGVALNSIDVVGLWVELMIGLSYEKFGAAGGDIGSHVSRYVALDHPERVVAVHRVAGAHRQRRASHRTRAWWAIRTVRATRTVCTGVARTLPGIPVATLVILANFVIGPRA
jgi:pimeloyl-ACP methyl ester carboxylesterase